MTSFTLPPKGPSSPNLLIPIPHLLAGVPPRRTLSHAVPSSHLLSHQSESPTAWLRPPNPLVLSRTFFCSQTLAPCLLSSSPAPSYLSRHPPWPCSKTQPLTAEPGVGCGCSSGLLDPSLVSFTGLLLPPALGVGIPKGHSQTPSSSFSFSGSSPLPSHFQHPLSPPKLQAAPPESCPTPQTHLCQTTLSHHPHLQLPTFALTPIREQNAHTLSRPTAPVPQALLSISHLAPQNTIGSTALPTPLASFASPALPHYPPNSPGVFPWPQSPHTYHLKQRWL